MVKKIYFDGLFYKSSGIGRYYESLMKGLAQSGVTIYTCIPLRLKCDFEKDFSNIKGNIVPIFVDYEKFSVKGFIKQSGILKNLENEVELFFFPHINLPFYIPENTVVTIHDLIPFTEFWDGSKIKRKIFAYYFCRALNKSKRIIAVSYSVARDLTDFASKLSASEKIRNKIEVIYEFIDDKFHECLHKMDALIKENYILFVGNRKKHKNIKNLILAFDKIKNRIDAKLVIAGSKHKNNSSKDDVDTLIDKLNLKNRIIEIENPSDDIIINLYQHAEILVLPSLIEGFGLPPLEALALGCPVITSNIPVFREILGYKIACFNPYDVDDIADKMYKALTNNALKYEILLEGRGRLLLYKKDVIVGNYLECFEKLIK